MKMFSRFNRFSNRLLTVRLSFSLYLVIPLFLLTTVSAVTAKPTPVRRADAIIYGGTSAAVMAAVQVRTMGKSVIIVSTDTHLGGLSAGGRGFTDTGNKEVIGGSAREFYQRLYQHYQKKRAWT